MNAGHSENGEVAECDKSLWDKVWDYILKTLEMLFKGNASEDVTLLGVIAEIAAAIFGVDIILDVRDIIADIYLTATGKQAFGWIVFDIVMLVPVIGVAKYWDEICALRKKVDWSDVLQNIKKWFGKGDNTLDITRKEQKAIIESSESSADGSKSLTNIQKGNYGEMRDTFKSQDYFERKIDSENKRIVKFKDALMKLDATNEKGIKSEKYIWQIYF